MAKFRVQRKATVWVEITLEADSRDEAEEIAQENDKEWVFYPILEDSFDWATDSLTDLWIEEKL